MEDKRDCDRVKSILSRKEWTIYGDKGFDQKEVAIGGGHVRGEICLLDRFHT